MSVYGRECLPERVQANAVTAVFVCPYSEMLVSGHKGSRCDGRRMMPACMRAACTRARECRYRCAQGAVTRCHRALPCMHARDRVADQSQTSSGASNGMWVMTPGLGAPYINNK